MSRQGQVFSPPPQTKKQTNTKTTLQPVFESLRWSLLFTFLREMICCWWTQWTVLARTNTRFLVKKPKLCQLSTYRFRFHRRINVSSVFITHQQSNKARHESTSVLCNMNTRAASSHRVWNGAAEPACLRSLWRLWRRGSVGAGGQSAFWESPSGRVHHMTGPGLLCQSWAYGYRDMVSHSELPR